MAQKLWHFNPRLDQRPDEMQYDYIEHGSLEHQTLEGIRPVEKGETPAPAYVYKGFTFLDPGEFLGPFTRPEYVMAVLKGKVEVVLAGAPTVPALPVWTP